MKAFWSSMDFRILRSTCFICAFPGSGVSIPYQLGHVSRFGVLPVSLFQVRRLPTICEAGAMKHEPTRLLSDLESAANFVGANPVLAVGEHPSGRKPLAAAD